MSVGPLHNIHVNTRRHGRFLQFAPRFGLEPVKDIRTIKAKYREAQVPEQQILKVWI